MTEDALNSAISSGSAKTVQPDTSTQPPASAAVPGQEPTSTDQFIPLLAQIQNVQFALPSPPTKAPQSLADQIQFVYDGTSYWLYFWANNQWNGIIVSPDDFGDGADGDVTIGADTTLTRDMFYKSLTISPGFTLSPNGFRIYCQSPIMVYGTISVKGGDGGAGSAGQSITGTGAGTGGAGGSAGVGNPSGTLKWPSGVAGKIGGAGGVGSPNLENGNAGAAEPNCLLPNNAASGGDSGSGGIVLSTGFTNNHSTGGVGGTATRTTRPSSLHIAIALANALGILGANPTPGSGAGAGGGVAGTSPFAQGGGGGGGGSGAPGGILWICAPAVIVQIGGIITANGGAGGHGGAGGSASGATDNDGGGGGGGGGGGNGGLILLITPTYTNLGTVTATGGAAGLGGAAGIGTNNSGQAGATATSSANGQIVQIVP